MTATARTEANSERAGTMARVPFGMLQRKCACGGTADVSGQCEQCNGKRLWMQRYPAAHVPVASLIESSGADYHAPGPSAMTSGEPPGHNFGSIDVRSRAEDEIWKKSTTGDTGDRFEEEADRLAESVVRDMQPANDTSRTKVSAVGDTLIQRRPADQTPVDAQEEQTGESAAEAESAPNATPEVAFIVEDDAAQVGGGQMRKGEFLAEMERAVCAAADSELVRAGRTAQGCPYIQQWIAFYRRQSASHVERALRRYAPEAAAASSARGYIPAVADRVRQAASTWVETGKITGVPDELAGGFESAGLAALLGGAAMAIGGIFMKARQGGSKAPVDPHQIKAQLGSGGSLEGSIRSRMESGFGHDFSRVRVHTDSKAADLSSKLNARAFTIGNDVAFAEGEYKPGSLIGDALIAHELAHVVQQSGGDTSVAPMEVEKGALDGLEEDADRSAASVVASMWSGAKGTLTDISASTGPRLRSGLRISRCRTVNERANTCTTNTTAATPAKTITVRHSHLWDGDPTVTFTSQLAYANTVYAIAGITFAAGNEENIDQTNTKDAALLGSNGLLDDSGTNPKISSYTAEERALMAHNEASGEVTAYYLKGVENTANLGGRAFLQDDALIIMPGQMKRTLAHEVGHILGGAGHPSNNDNIMAQNPDATGVDCLSDGQIEAVRESSLAK